MLFLQRQRVRELKVLIERRKDFIFQTNQKQWYWQYGYFPDWHLGREFGGDTVLAAYYEELEKLIDYEK